MFVAGISSLIAVCFLSNIYTHNLHKCFVCVQWNSSSSPLDCHPPNMHCFIQNTSTPSETSTHSFPLWTAKTQPFVTAEVVFVSLFHPAPPSTVQLKKLQSTCCHDSCLHQSIKRTETSHCAPPTTFTTHSQHPLHHWDPPQFSSTTTLGPHTSLLTGYRNAKPVSEVAFINKLVWSHPVFSFFMMNKEMHLCLILELFGN